jgi:hypothetical protein
MKHKLILFLLFEFFCFFISAQKKQTGDTIRIEGETIEIVVPLKKLYQKNNKPTEEIKQVQVDIQKELKDYTLEMQDQKFISENVVTQVDVEKIDNNLKVIYSYSLLNDTLVFQGDDFGLGKYGVDASHAMLVTLGIMKKNFEGKLVKYVTPQTRIFMSVNGSADATPIRNSIDYKGEYGDFISENCIVEGNPRKMEISTRKGISDNNVLAFLRAYAVKDHIEKNIEPLKHTFNKWQYTATVKEQRGGKFRRVSIELNIVNAFEN